MEYKSRYQRFAAGLLFLFAVALAPDPSAAARMRPQVLVVMSYEHDYKWAVEIREGIEQVLDGVADLTFFYLDTKVGLAAGPHKAAAAYKLFQQLEPDGVIAVDDHAQTMFVIPYLKNRTPVPVVFCGVNADPADYGYPAENVTGILERYHFEESISLNRLIAGRTETFAVMVNESPLADLVAAQLEQNSAKLSARPVALLRPKTLGEARQMASEYRARVDLLMILTLRGISDEDGVPVPNDGAAIATVVETFAKPTAATAEFAIRNGVLSGVLAGGHEQGMQSALMLRDILAGKPVTELPVTRNYRGVRMINVTTMKRLGLNPRPIMLRGVTLVRSEKPISL